jgi:hypothetical protein
VNAAQALRHAVRQGGPWDLQRSYNGQSNALFASLFTSAASYTYGLIGAAAGFSPTTLMAGGGMYNLLMNPKRLARTSAITRTIRRSSRRASRTFLLLLMGRQLLFQITRFREVQHSPGRSIDSQLRLIACRRARWTTSIR